MMGEAVGVAPCGEDCPPLLTPLPVRAAAGRAGEGGEMGGPQRLHKECSPMDTFISVQGGSLQRSDL